MKTKDSFVFRKGWAEAINGLPDEVRLEFYDALIGYAFSGKTTDLKPMAGLAFRFAKAQLDRDVEQEEKDEDIRRKRSEAGRRGGKASKQKADLLQAKGKQDEYLLKQNDNLLQAKSEFASSKIKQNQANENLLKQNSNAHAHNNISYSNNKEDKKETTTKVVVEKEEERNTPQPPSLVNPLVTRQKAFYDSLRAYVGQYPADILRCFYDYWSEPNRSQTKMRMEMEKTWDVGRRLAYWYRREEEKNYGTTSRPDTAEQRAEDVASIIARLAAEDDAAAAAQ